MLYAPEMVDYSYSDELALTSNWLGLNLFMLSPELAVVTVPVAGRAGRDQVDVAVYLLAVRGRQVAVSNHERAEGREEPVGLVHRDLGRALSFRELREAEFRVRAHWVVILSEGFPRPTYSLS